jgi:hypothetical protein
MTEGNTRYDVEVANVAEEGDMRGYHTDQEDWECECDTPLKSGAPFLNFFGACEGVQLGSVLLVRQHGIETKLLDTLYHLTRANQTAVERYLRSFCSKGNGDARDAWHLSKFGLYSRGARRAGHAINAQGDFVRSNGRNERCVEANIRDFLGEEV